MALDNPLPVPTDAPLKDVAGTFTDDFLKWLTVLATLVNRLRRVVAFSVTTQAAAIATTILLARGASATGLYLVTYFVHVTQAATTSSAIQVTVGTKADGVALTKVGANLNGNTTATWESVTMLVRADAVTDLTIAATYASVGATPMQFELSVIVRQV